MEEYGTLRLLARYCVTGYGQVKQRIGFHLTCDIICIM